MILGISGSNKNNLKEVAKYLENYNYKVIDIDQIYEKMISQENNALNVYDHFNYTISILNIIDKEIIEMIKSSNDNVLVTFTNLEALNVFQLIDTTININSSNYAVDNIIDKYIVDSRIVNKSVDYNLKIDFDNDWKTKLDEFIEFNIKGEKKVSIIVPIYNSSDYLVRCINSIIKQNYRNLEIILVNDGSIDNSLEICKMMSKMDNRIRIISQENKGLSEARNKGFSISTGDYICFIDSDDYMDKNMIETLLKNALQYDADVSSVRAHVHTRNGTIREYSEERKISFYEGKDEAIHKYADSEISIAVWDKLFKRQKIENIVFDKNTYQEDADFMFKVCSTGGKYICDTKACYNYFKGNSNSITSAIDKKLFQLRNWSIQAYKYLIDEYGMAHKMDANKILFNGLSHIIKMYFRDLKLKKITSKQYNKEIQQTTNDLLKLLFDSENISEYFDIENVLNIIRSLKREKVITTEDTINKDLNCIGILWNSLDNILIQSAINDIKKYCDIKKCDIIDFKNDYCNFINDIYSLDKEFEGVSYLKSCSLIDKYESNNIAILYLKIKVTDFTKTKLKGYLYKEVSDLKDEIRKEYKVKIKNYAFDTLFHLTVNEKEFKYTDEIVKKYISNKNGEQIHGREENSKCKKLSFNRNDKKDI